MALGNLNLYTAPKGRREPKDLERLANHLSYAAADYTQALQRDPACLWAAQGAGCALAEAGHLAEARVAFEAVREAAAASRGFVYVPDVLINLAHVALAEEQYAVATALYETALGGREGTASGNGPGRKSGATSSTLQRDRHAGVLVSLARAQYDANHLPEARKALVRSLHDDPSSAATWFDVGLTLQESAVRAVNKRRPVGDERKLPEFETSRRSLDTAHRVFRFLLHRGPRATGIKDKNLQVHIEFVAKTRERVAKAVEEAKREAELTRARREQSRLALEAARKAQAAVEEETRLLAEAEARAREEIAREHARKLERLKEAWKEAAALQKAVDAGDAGAIKRQSKSNVASVTTTGFLAPDQLEDESEDEDFDPHRPDEGMMIVDGDAGLECTCVLVFVP